MKATVLLQMLRQFDELNCWRNMTPARSHGVRLFLRSIFPLLALMIVLAVPAFAADAPVCADVKSRLANAVPFLEVDLPPIRVFWKQANNYHLPPDLRAEDWTFRLAGFEGVNGSQGKGELDSDEGRVQSLRIDWPLRIDWRFRPSG